MQIIDVTPTQARSVTHHGSLGLQAQALVRSDGVAVTVLRVAAGGEIGRHPAVADQLFLVVAGDGEVNGDDGVWHRLTVGQAALWTSGEHHTTKAVKDLVAVVVEAPDLSRAIVPTDR